MTFWEFLLTNIPVILTAIAAYIPMKFEIHKQNSHKPTTAGWWFIGLSLGAIASGVFVNYNAWQQSLKSEKDNTLQQEALSSELKSLKESNLKEQEKTRKMIIDSMKAESKFQEGEMKRRMDSVEASRQRRLTASDKANLIKLIDNLRATEKLDKNITMRVISAMGNGEARKYAREVFDFLNSKGYPLIYATNSSGEISFEGFFGIQSEKFGVFYDRRQNMIVIDVGLIGSRPK